MKDRIVWKGACTIFVLCAAVASPAQTFTSLAKFDLLNGANPFYMSLVQGPDGNFYGTTSDGGGGTGTIFRVTPEGALTTLYRSCSQVSCAEGDGFSYGLVLATDGNFYGTASEGGAYNYGAIYRITAGGTLTTLHSFDGTDGIGSYPPLIEGTDGNLYGVTPAGGAYDSGTLYKITLDGTLTTLYSFCAQTNCADGQSPFAGLIQGTDGNFYGTTVAGGANNFGTVFKFAPGGALTTLYSFCSQTNCTDGYATHSALVQAGEYFYGTTTLGGNGAGTVFKITSEGALTTIYRFCQLCRLGGIPVAGLTQGTDGNLYGTTVPGAGSSDYSYGTIYQITRGGKVTFLHEFGATGGSTPYGGLLQGTDGTFYGTTTYGGDGTVFSLSMGLAPFVTSLPIAGKAGWAVKILGTDLTGSTSVSFNGTAAAFTVVSATEISTRVPVGATTGEIQVTTPTGVLLSKVGFRVGN